MWCFEVVDEEDESVVAMGDKCLRSTVFGKDFGFTVWSLVIAFVLY
jgi:hypothetical protein